MARKNTDTNIWSKEWFRKLSPKMKCAWRFLCDNCNHAGVWDVDVERLSFLVGEKITKEEIESAFSDRVIFYKKDKLFLLGYIDFHYKGLVNLSKANNCHRSVKEILTKEGLLKFLNDSAGVSAPALPLPCPCPAPAQGHKEEEEEKETETETEEVLKKGSVRGADAPHHTSTQTFEARFRKDRPVTMSFLHDSKLMNGDILRHLPKIFESFPTDEDFETWVRDIQHSTSYREITKKHKNADAQESNLRSYVKVSLLKACGAMRRQNDEP